MSQFVHFNQETDRKNNTYMYLLVFSFLSYCLGTLHLRIANYQSVIGSWIVIWLCFLLSVTRLVNLIWIYCLRLPDYLANIMASFTSEKYALILYCCGYYDGDAAGASREYLAQFFVHFESNVSVYNKRIRESGRVQRRTSTDGRPCVYAPSLKGRSNNINLDNCKRLGKSYPSLYTPVQCSGRSYEEARF